MRQTRRCAAHGGHRIWGGLVDGVFAVIALSSASARLVFSSFPVLTQVARNRRSQLPHRMHSHAAKRVSSRIPPFLPVQRDTAIPIITGRRPNDGSFAYEAKFPDSDQHRS
jgi:hypothetical protein